MELYDLDPDELKSLLEHSLALAAQTGKVALVRRLLDAGVNPNACDDERNPALLLAAEASSENKDCVEVVEHLLEAGASATYAPLGDDPLNKVLMSDRPELRVVKALLDAGANPNVCRGNTFLAAIEVHSPEIVRALIDAGADVNRAVPVDGPEHTETSFYVAARCGRASIAQMLVDAGAKIDVEAFDSGFWKRYQGHTGTNPVERIVNAERMRLSVANAMSSEGFEDAAPKQGNAGPSPL